MTQKTEDPKIFIPITRVDEDERMVFGYGVREDLKDSYGTIIDLESVKACLPDYMKWRNIREMHQMSAVGRADEITTDAKGIYLGAKVIDDDAWKKVKEKVYNGFSIGGKKEKQVDDRIFLRSITEFSLVDRPSNEGCQIDEYRIAGGEKDMEEKIVEIKKAEVIAAKEATDKTEKADVPDLKRFLGEEIMDVGIALQCLDSLMYLFAKEATEDHPEAAGQAADLKAVIEKLKSFIASEIKEVQVQTEFQAPSITNLAEAPGDVERKGSRHNIDDLKLIQGIHDSCASLGCRCEAVEKADVPDVTRMAALETDLEAKTKENADLLERIKKLEAEPVPAKGPLNTLAVKKEEDGKTENIQRVEDTNEFKQADEKGKALIIMRSQLAKPMRVSAG